MRYFLETSPGVLAVLVRHASTALNNPSNPIVRAWKDEPLSGKGRTEAQLAALRLRKYAPKYIFNSDFMRDTETANIIANELNLNLETDFDSRTWDVGIYSGKPESEVNPRIMELYRRSWEVPPGSSESFDDFSRRWRKFLDKKLDLASNVESYRPIVIVTHGRCCALTQSYIEGTYPLYCDMPFPAGLGIISVNVDGSLSYETQEPKERVIEDV